MPCLVPEDPFQDSLLEWRHLCMSARYIRPDEALWTLSRFLVSPQAPREFVSYPSISCPSISCSSTWKAFPSCWFSRVHFAAYPAKQEIGNVVTGQKLGLTNTFILDSIGRGSMVISSVLLSTILALALSISLHKDILKNLKLWFSANSPGLLPWPVPDEVDGVGDEVPQEEEDTDQSDHKAHGFTLHCNSSNLFLPFTILFLFVFFTSLVRA